MLACGVPAKLTAAVASATKSRTAVASLAQTSLSNPNDQQAKTALLTAMKALDGELSAIKDVRGRVNVFVRRAAAHVAHTALGSAAIGRAHVRVLR